MQTDVETRASSCVLDASAVLALILQERGKEAVSLALVHGAAVSSINLSEVFSRLLDLGFEIADAIQTVAELQFERVPFTVELALATALLRPLTRNAGLSLGDRACLALAQELNVPALTADRTWANLKLDIDVEVIR